MKVCQQMNWKHVFYAGTISGTGLALFLWIIEQLFDYRVFTLLLNVDFIPVVGGINWPVVVEFLFHLFISWVIAAGYSIYLYIKPRTNFQEWTTVLILSIGAGLSYFPLSELAIKSVPSITDFRAAMYWFIGHLLYAVLLKISSKSVSGEK